MITWVSVAAFVVVMGAMWAWVSHQRNHGHAKKRDR